MYARLTFFGIVLATVLLIPSLTAAQAILTGTATTTLTLSICGNSLVDDGEQCDVPGETGVYSTSIAGRQCSLSCNFGPYCGDGVLQTSFGEECDDGNNDDADFCSAICIIEPAGSGGVGSAGKFDFTTDASPGTASLGFWATDQGGTRSITLNSTFDVTQGAVTNISGIILPPSIKVSSANVNPGDIVTVSGQSIPNARIELHINNSEKIETTTSSATGLWTILLNTTSLRVAEHTLRARSIGGTSSLATQSSFSTTIQLFVGVNGKATTPSDLNRDTKINLVDFSILIFWCGTNGGNSNPPADINGNGKVGIEDFSILLFNWTG